MKKTNTRIDVRNPRTGFHLPGVLLFLMLLAMAACSSTASNTLERQIAEAEERWQVAGITSYEIEVLQVGSIWWAQSIRLHVIDGEVVESEASCIPAPTQMGECEVRPYEAADYTVEALFARARTEAARGNGEFTTIEFDEEHGFPRRISYDHPDIVDEDQSLRVTDFVVYD